MPFLYGSGPRAAEAAVVSEVTVPQRGNMAIWERPIAEVQNDDLTEEDLMQYLYSLLRHPMHDLTRSMEIPQYDAFLNVGIPLIVKTMFNPTITLQNERSMTDADKKITAFTISIAYTDVSLKTPTQIDRDGMEVPRNPDDYRVNNAFYAADLILSCEISIVATTSGGEIYGSLKSLIKDINVSSVPIMIKSSHCNTKDSPPETLESIREDPLDPGGYFIAGGQERVISVNENLAYNKPLIFKATLKGERVRAIMISQRGNAFEHSSMLDVTYTSEGAIQFKVQAASFVKTKVPFYQIFRMLGVAQDKAIANMIVYDMDDKGEVTKKLMELVVQAFKAKYPGYESMRDTTMPTNALLRFHESSTEAADPLRYRSVENAVRHATASAVDVLDSNLLPHIGTTGDHKTRYKKLLFIGALIRDILMVIIGMREDDDRDHIANKRVHGAGLNMAKAFKTLFNSKVHMPIAKMLRNEVTHKSFDIINIGELASNIKTNVSKDDLQSAFEKCINAAKESQMREKVRMSAQALEHKNRLTVLATLRTVMATVSKVAKTTKRNDLIRYWHSSSEGIYCPAHTPESEKVGTVKQLGITAIITGYSEGLGRYIKDMIAEDEAIIPVDDLKLERIPRERLTKIVVDGDWIGCCMDPHIFVARYREKRRRGEIDRYASIEWNSVTNIICFYTDMGRLMRPLLIVDNNLSDFDSGKTDKFIQNIRLTKSDVRKLMKGELSFEDLIRMGYVEYIYPGEEVLLCPSPSVLRETRHDFTQPWTHCNIPQALFGITVLVSPYLDRTEPFRNSLVTVHSKQACGQPYSNVKATTRLNQRFSLYRVDNPTVKTIMRDFVPPSSQNLMVLYGIFLGYNQEDSSMVNRASQEIGMLKGSYYKVVHVEIEKGMTICVPDPERTSVYRKNMSYAKLDGAGFIPVGTLIKKGDIILGIVVELAEARDGKSFIDRSEQYTNDEEGRLISIIKKLDGTRKFVSMTFEYIRNLAVGDKMSSRAGNKNINGILIPLCDMPHTEDGVRPDVILNPHSIPSRMTFAQLFETTIQKLCAKKGVFIDGTVYKKLDIYELFDELEKEGVAVRERLTNGITGEVFDAMLFMGPQSTIRLPKFVIEDRHAVGRTGPINPMTAQALTGKRVHGGHKVGEMEAHVFLAQGTISTFFESFYLDSDFRKIYICRGCNEPAIYNEKESRYRCRICRDRADITTLNSCKTTMLVLHEWAAANIKVELVPEGRKFEIA